MGWIRFSMVRSAVFGFLFVSSVAILALISWQASMFLDNRYDKPYIIFGLVVSIVTILAILGLATRYTFKTHIGIITVLAILWLAFASYTTDRIGYLQCESLQGTRRPKSVNGTFDNVAWCRMMKAIMAFSWFNFAGLIIAVVSWIRLQEYEENRGFREEGSSRRESYRAADTANFRHGFQAGAMPVMTGGGQPMIQGANGGAVVYQQPGHNVVVQDGQVRQVPVGAPIY